MTIALRLAAVAAIGVIISFAAGRSEARVHHHHHHVAAADAPTAACGRHHHHCHATTAPGATTRTVCARHHRHCHAVAANGAAMVCGRHHRHCHLAVSRYSRRSAASVAGAGEHTGDNGVCKSVRLHGEWVQQCNFSNQGQ